MVKTFLHGGDSPPRPRRGGTKIRWSEKQYEEIPGGGSSRKNNRLQHVYRPLQEKSHESHKADSVTVRLMSPKVSAAPCASNEREHQCSTAVISCSLLLDTTPFCCFQEAAIFGGLSSNSIQPSPAKLFCSVTGTSQGNYIIGLSLPKSTSSHFLRHWTVRGILQRESHLLDHLIIFTCICKMITNYKKK